MPNPPDPAPEPAAGPAVPAEIDHAATAPPPAAATEDKPQTLETERIPPRGASGGEAEPQVLEAERIPPRAAPAARRFAALPVAWSVAIAADAIQWIIWPVFLAGAASPVDDIVDVVVAAVLIKLLGWHWVFAPSFVVELLPVADFVPTWTMAVWIASRGRAKR